MNIRVMAQPSARLELDWKRWTVILGLVLFAGVLDSVQYYFASLLEGRPERWSSIIFCSVTYWLPYAALVPLVFFLANRYRLDHHHRFRNFLIHVAAAHSFAYVHTVVVAMLDPSQLGPAGLVPGLLHLVRLNFPLDFLTYSAIVGATYAVNYYSESRQRELAEARLAASLTEARLRALEAQLNPHFLFNTLNAISVLALKGEQHAVAEMLGRLSNLLRASFDDKRPQRISLAEELDFLDSYLDIQRLWFGDRLTIGREIPQGALAASVPRMILQPLVENAIVHGIAKRPGSGSITIEAAREQQNLRLRVSDNGPGFRGHDPRGKGIGLANTHARLDQIYGSNHRLEYGQSANGGAAVTIWIPFVESDADVAPMRKAG